MKNINGLLQPWQKGQSGNPKGAKKGMRHWNVVLREQFEKGQISQDDIAAAVIKQAKAGNLKAFEVIADRMDGKPTSSIIAEISPAQNLPVPRPEYSTDKIAQILCILEEAGVIPHPQIK